MRKAFRSEAFRYAGQEPRAGSDTLDQSKPFTLLLASAHDAAASGLLVMMWIRAATALTAILCCGTAMAQQAPGQQTQQSAVTWENMPRMQLEQQYAGPLKDTLIQRWRDPETNLICYVYLPITAAHSPPTPTSYVQYGPNVIGSISCVSPPAGTSLPPVAAKPPAPAGKPAPPRTPPKDNPQRE